MGNVSTTWSWTQIRHLWDGGGSWSLKKCIALLGVLTLPHGQDMGLYSPPASVCGEVR